MALIPCSFYSIPGFYVFRICYRQWQAPKRLTLVMSSAYLLISRIEACDIHIYCSKVIQLLSNTTRTRFTIICTMSDYLSPTAQARIEENIAFLEQEEERDYIQGKKRKLGDIDDNYSMNPKEIASGKDFDVASPINLEGIEALGERDRASAAQRGRGR